MKNQFLLATLLPLLCFGQTKDSIINPKHNWYFGAEMGLNKISSFSLNESNESFQFGLLAEYYFARHWSVSGRIKYFETGVSFYSPNTHSGSWLDLGHDAYYGQFQGATITLPINIKWEFRVYRNFGASLKLGYAHSFETKSQYIDYSSNLTIDYSKQYGNFNLGYGGNYFLNKKMAIYIDLETYFGQSKGHSPNFIWGDNHYITINSLINFGVKYNFKKL